jgi:hypothetical protein
MTYINCLLTSSQQVQFKMDCACPQLSPACVMLLPVYEKNVIAVINISCLTNSAAWSFLGPNNNYIHYWQQYQHSPAPEACAGACLVLSFRTCHSHSNAADVVTSLSRWLSVQSKSKHIYIYIYICIQCRQNLCMHVPTCTMHMKEHHWSEVMALANSPLAFNKCAEHDVTVV